MAREVDGSAVVYLEFGVADGDSLRWWVNRLTHPQNEFHGFDSFRGLPETFDGTYAKGHFDRDGVPPNIVDERVTFHTGWFQDTLPSFTPRSDKPLVIVLDADLYSSTSFVLNELKGSITLGTLIYFDELSRIDHEPAAFDDFMQSTGKRFAAVALEDNFNTGAFKCIEA